MVRLDANLLAATPSYLNPLKDRELDLRGYKIPAIENLGVTKDTLDSLDLTDNSITNLTNFPLLKRLKHLLLSNNPIRSISSSLPNSLPNLKSLILINCSINLNQLSLIGEILSKFKKLEILVLKGNEISEGEFYKDWIVFKCIKNLRSLDFERITDKDKAHAKSLFLLPSGQPTPLSLKLSANASITASSFTASNGLTKTFEPGFEPNLEVVNGGGSSKVGRLLSKEEKERVRSAIEAAGSVEEIRRLQRMLAQGFVPSEKDLKDLQKKKGGIESMDQS